MPLNDIVNVQITRETQTVSEAGFGTLMILGTFKNWNNRIRYYTSMQQVAADFSPSQDVYVAAQAVFSQKITPDQIAIGRRQADDATVEVITAQTGKNYNVTINGETFTVPSTNTTQESTVTFSADFVANNLIQVVLNDVNVGTVTSIINFDIDFVSLNSIVATVNGVALSANTFTSNQATTIAAVATKIGTATGVASSTVTGARQITVVFTDPGNNTVDSVITTLGATQPTATISEGSFVFDTDQLTTMTNIADAIELEPGINSVEISANGATPDRVLQIFGDVNMPGVVNSVTVSLGVSQASAIIVNNNQQTTVQSIADLLVQEINANATVTVTQSTALIAGNSTVVTLNGIALAPVLYASSNASTLTAIAALIAMQSGIDSAVSNGTNAITIVPTTGLGVEASFVTTLGASQPTWASVYADQVNAINNNDGTFTLEASTPGTPYTLTVSTNIINANSGRITIEEANPNTLYEIRINGKTFQYTSPIEVQTNEEIAAAFVSLINADPLLSVTATDNLDGSFELDSDDDTQTFVCRVTPILITYQFGMVIDPIVASDSVTSDLDAIQGIDDNWYAIAYTGRDSGTVQQIAAWTEARIKIFGTSSADPNIIDQEVGVDTTSIAAIFNNLGYVRTFVIYSQDANSDYPECAWFGNCLPLQPGSETWAFKSLTTIPYSDLTVTESLNCRNKEANTYEFIGGVGITQNGTMAQGEYIDIIRGVDWLTSNIQSNVYSVLVNSPKIPYTDAGITIIEGQIKKSLNLGISNNFISADPAPVVMVPKAANVSSADKSARILRNVTFQATLAGAIQAVRIQGTVTV